MIKYYSFWEKIIDDYNKKHNKLYYIRRFALFLDKKYKRAEKIEDLYIELFYTYTIRLYITYDASYGSLFSKIYSTKEYLLGKPND